MPNRTKAEKWRAEETDKFFMALQVFGTDFSMIEKLFADRSREQIKVWPFPIEVIRTSSARRKDGTRLMSIGSWPTKSDCRSRTSKPSLALWT